MTRIAIVASSEELRATLAAALGAHPAFEIVAIGASVDDVPPSADVIVVARSGTLGDHERETVLTNREREILELLSDGLGNKQIAARLGISTNTVKTHLELLFEKLDVSSRAEAVARGVKEGLLLF